MYGSAEPCDSGVAMGDRGLEDDSRKDGAALPETMLSAAQHGSGRFPCWWAVCG